MPALIRKCGNLITSVHMYVLFILLFIGLLIYHTFMINFGQQKEVEGWQGRVPYVSFKCVSKIKLILSIFFHAI